MTKDQVMYAAYSKSPLTVRVWAQVQKEAVQSVEQDGMVFIDEIDKIVVGSEMRYGRYLQTCGHATRGMHLLWRLI